MRTVACFLILVLGAFGCKKKPEPAVAAVEAPAPVTVATPADPDAPPPPIPAGNEVGSGNQLDLAALNKIFKSYCATLDNGKPRSLGELVAAGYMDRLPNPPKGKRLEIDFKKMEVVLVAE